MATVEELRKVTLSDVRSLRTSQLVLRKATKSDAPQIAALFKKVQENGQNFYLAPPVNADEKEIADNANARVNQWIDWYAPDPNTKVQEHNKFVVTLPGDPDTLIGYISIDGLSKKLDRKKLEEENYRDIGYCFLPAHQNKGCATEASRIVIAGYFNDTADDPENPDNDERNTVYITYHPHNGPSKRVAQKLGYIEDPTVTTLTKTMGDGSMEPRTLGSMTREEFYAALEASPCRTAATNAKVIKQSSRASISPP